MKKTTVKTILIIITFLFFVMKTEAQMWKLGGNPDFGGLGLVSNSNYFGGTQSAPLRFGTGGTTHMFMQNNTGPNAGFLGLSTTNPLFRLHIDGAGTGDATALGWNKGILLSNDAALMWQGAPSPLGPGTPWNYFMAHASNSPVGDFYQGMSNGIGTAAAVVYASKVHVGSFAFGIPQASTQIFKNLLVEEPGIMRSLGVNILVPQRSGDIFHATDPQLRLTQTQNNFFPALRIYTDLQTTNLGHFNIIPRSGFAARNVGIDIAVPTHKLDIGGNLRIRNVQNDPTPDFLLLGNPLAANDMEVQKLAFTGSNTDVLLGDGTFGTITPTALDAYNGCSMDYTLTTPRVVWGQDCGAALSPAKLVNDREIPFNTHNVYFTGQGTATTNAMGLGYICSSPMPAKLNVLQRTAAPIFVSTLAGHFHNSDFGDASTSSLFFIGVHGRSDFPQPGNNTNIGGDFVAERGPICFGVRGTANAGGPASVSYAGRFTALSGASSTNYGVYSQANNATANSYAIYATSLPAVGAPPLAPGLLRYAGYFDGDVYISGSFGPSDIALKENLDTIASAISIIDQLQPKKFNYKSSSFPSMNLPLGLQYGLIAQDVETVLPELVSDNIHPAQYDTLGNLITAAVNFKGLEYQQLIPILIKGMQEQQNTIESLTDQLSTLQNCINNLNLCDNPSLMENDGNNGSSDVKSKDVELKDGQTLILDQNVPNPFAEMTTITYTLNDGIQKAQMLFYNASGKLINSLDLQTTSGKGQLNVFANDLSSGIYTYTLVVDGKIVDTKRMVKK